MYPPAEFNMGVLYAEGLGVPRDLAQAVEWYRKAAEWELPQAQDALRTLAVTGFPPAQHVLGMTYENGWGSAKIEAEAVHWYRKAAEQGYPPAEYDLGRMLAEGRGALKNEAEAEAWFRRAAEEGIREAQIRLDALSAPTPPSN
jgi:TPR repeat protein